jgi:hypothetical protein
MPIFPLLKIFKRGNMIFPDSPILRFPHSPIPRFPVPPFKDSHNIMNLTRDWVNLAWGLTIPQPLYFKFS